MSSNFVGASSARSRAGLAAVLALTLASTTAWGRGGGGGHGGAHFGGGLGGGHFAGRPLGETRGFDRFGGGRFPHLDHGREISPYLYAPFYHYGYSDPGYWYDGYCDPYSPYYNPASCYY